MLLAMFLLAAATSEVRLVMGTRAEVQVAGVEAPADAVDAAFGALDVVDRSMSLWKESELTRLNRAGEARVSPELQAVLEHALEVAAASEGAFDPTVEPLVRAAGGFGGTRRSLTSAERERLLAHVGARHVHLDRASGSVRLDPGTALDLGGIAKGFAVDLALRALRAAGAESGLVDLGQSSVSVFGQPPDAGGPQSGAAGRARLGALRVYPRVTSRPRVAISARTTSSTRVRGGRRAACYPRP